MLVFCIDLEVDDMYKETFYQALRLLLVICGCMSLYLFLKYAMIYFHPFLLAILFSLLMNPPVSMLEERLKVPRFFATFIVLLTTFIFMIGAIIFIVTELVSGTTYLAYKIPTHFYIFMDFIKQLFHEKLLPIYHKMLNHEQQLTVNQKIQDFGENLTRTGATVLENMLLKIPSLLSKLPYSMTLFIFVIIATFLITNDWPSLKRMMKKMIPACGQHVFIHFRRSLVGFIKAQITMVTITACMIFIGLIFLRVNHALTIVLFAAIADFLPYVGIGFIFIPWIIYLFIVKNYSLTISLSILYIIVIILRQIIEPKIISVHIGLKPLTALVAIFIGFQLWGLLGIMIAPILLIFLHAIYQAGLMEYIWTFIKGANE